VQPQRRHVRMCTLPSIEVYSGTSCDTKAGYALPTTASRTPIARGICVPARGTTYTCRISPTSTSAVVMQPPRMHLGAHQLPVSMTPGTRCHDRTTTHADVVRTCEYAS